MSTAGQPPQSHQWTNASVRALAGDSDPVGYIVDRARSLFSGAVDEGMPSAPFDPFMLAELLGLSLRPRADVTDARIVVGEGSKRDPSAVLSGFVPSGDHLVIEYNPTRPRGRLRYSVAHEIAHALFPDVSDSTRHRTAMGAVPGSAESDGWELELLCNIVAAELLMPREAIEGFADTEPDIDFLMAIRKRLDVSTEALMRRLASETSMSLTVVAMSRRDDRSADSLRVDYTVDSGSWAGSIATDEGVAPNGPAAEIAAVGQTVRGPQQIGTSTYDFQAVGVSPFPGRSFPRVLAIARVPGASDEIGGPEFVTGSVADADATEPIVITHVVTDSARTWSRTGVPAAIRMRYRQAADAFRAWAIASPENLRLGETHVVTVGPQSVVVASIVAQRGYGPGSTLDFDALGKGLDRVALEAERRGATVHMPRLGTGQAFARWDRVLKEINSRLVNRGVRVVVHTPAGSAYGGRDERAGWQ